MLQFPFYCVIFFSGDIMDFLKRIFAFNDCLFDIYYYGNKEDYMNKLTLLIGTHRFEELNEISRINWIQADPKFALFIQMRNDTSN